VASPSPDASGFIYTYPTAFDTAVITGLTVGALICFAIGVLLLVALITWLIQT
jgi:hypothetical protein